MTSTGPERIPLQLILRSLTEAEDNYWGTWIIRGVLGATIAWLNWARVGDTESWMTEVNYWPRHTLSSFWMLMVNMCNKLHIILILKFVVIFVSQSYVVIIVMLIGSLKKWPLIPKYVTWDIGNIERKNINVDREIKRMLPTMFVTTITSKLNSLCWY